MPTTTDADPFAPFLATIAERHYEMMFAPCPRCDGTRRVRYTDAAGDTDEKECPDCDKPRPADHGPAMVFADWLEEHGDCEWAEFIRSGIELGDALRGVHHTSTVCCEPHLRRSDLLARHGAEWARRVLGGVFPMVHAMRDYGHSGGSWDVIGGVVKWDWGVALPETFRFPTLAGFLGGVCGTCGGDKEITFHGGQRYSEVGGNPYMVQCHECSGSGFSTPPIGPALARRVPLRRVEFADKRPLHTGHEWFVWGRPINDGLPHAANHIPEELFDMIEPKNSKTNHKPFPTEAAAHDALSDAAIRFYQPKMLIDTKS